MRVEDLDYELPPELIAQQPAAERAASRLMHVRCADGAIAHRQFSDLAALLRPDDLLVMNNARVTPARFMLIKPTGGRVEGLFVEQRDARRAIVMLKNLGTIHSDVRLSFERMPARSIRVLSKQEGGLCEIELDEGASLVEILEAIGRMPLPPYIRRDKGGDDRDAVDATRYQTVYAERPGSIAAPTAGLHFTPEVFAALDARGIERALVTLHVGLGTFKPVEVDDLSQHVMHVERYELTPQACEAINRAQAQRRRIVAVGTTTTRVLESQPAGALTPHAGQTQLLIRPPYEWQRVGALVTNFHQPRSTLIALVAAFMGLEAQRSAYAEAIRRRYRFFSYGDAMFVE
jgi:S-adenosylmethionine:tRNA ribosyltransferase-isomerase